MKSTFWINLIKEYNIPDWENINNIFKLRKIYKDYYNLVNKIYEDEPKDLNKKNKDSKNRNAIKDDINQYLERDEFAFMLDALIKKFFEENHDKISNAEILGTIAKFNPYFSVKDKEDKDKYKNNREVYIFDYVNFNRITEVFIKNFKSFNFEKMFEENITDYINKITSKIENIQTFGNIIKLINEKEIKEEKQKDYFRILEDKYKLIIKKDIISMKGEKELEKLIKIIAEFVSKLFLFYNDNRFLDEEISSMDDKIKSLIYIELITIYNQEEYKKQKDRIFEIYLEKIETEEGRENVIKLIQRLKDDDKKFFIYEKLLKKCQFTKDDFFSNYENYKIQTLCLLNKELKEESKNEDQKKEEGKDKKKEEQSNILNILEAQNGNEYAEYLVKILDKILKDLDKGAIVKKDLEKFLNIKRPKNVPQKFEEDPAIKEKGKEDENNNTNKVEENEYVKEKLELLTLIVSTYSPKTKYADYKSTIEKINENVELLKFIKDSLMIFHRNKYNDNIKQITIILDEIENSPVQKFKTEDTKKTIERLVEQRTLCDEIKKVKDFLLFKKIFENAQGIDQAERFEDATRKLVELKELFKNNSKNIEVIFNNEKFLIIFKDIKEELSRKTENKSEEFVDQMIKYFKIEDKKVIKDLKMIINSKKYEMIVKSIKYFFDIFFEKFSKKNLSWPKNITLFEMNLKTLENTLKELKRAEIYDHEQNSPYYRVFTSIYAKREAIDFLIDKINLNVKNLRIKLIDKLDPTNHSISVKDIDDTIEYLTKFKEFVKFDDNNDILKCIKLLDEERIKTIENFSKKFGSIIELYNKNENEKPFQKVYDIIHDASLLLNLDYEDFGYTVDGKFIKIKDIEELIKLKNKINIQPQKKTNKPNEKSQTKEIKEKDIIEEKCDKLLFYKNVEADLEIIYDKINILRMKGFNIPIAINVDIKYPEITYKLNVQEKKFDKIKDYLFKVKNDYENQLNTIYENEKYLRLLYGKLFRKVKLHQEGNGEISELVRYILNKTSNKDKIQDGDLYNEKLGKDFEDQYNDYMKKIFVHISQYLISLFKKNDSNLQKHFDDMKIIKKDKFKGIAIKKCTKISMEEYILGLFMEKLGKLPIAQNILICSNETSIEEIQSFLYRAILCESNTLFVVEILESFSNFQHNKMYSYIDKLLSIKLEKYKKENKDNKIKDVDQSKSRDYLDSYIVFVYNKLDNENAFKNELEKYTRKNQKNEEEDKKLEDLRASFYIANKSKDINMDKENNLNNINLSNISNNTIEDNEDVSTSKIIISQDFDITKNIKVISSDVCGLGKSFKIKKMIKEEHKKYYHFLLGGKLTKNVIYQKISDLFKKIKKEEKPQKDANKKSEVKANKEQNDEEYSEFNNVVIHLDLIETKETSLVNEFLFSFLITKFYTNNENIIYIPNNIKIYIEVPNSFEDYLTKFGILNAFKIENIILGESKQNETNNAENILNIPMLPLELESDIKIKFKKSIGTDDNKEIEQFIKDNIGIKDYSYHQVDTFIKLYISQFNAFESKIKFTNSGEDKTQKCIQYFAETTKYFTNGGFSKLIMEKKHIKNIFELCLDVYESDLGNSKFDKTLIFIDKETKKFKFERLPDISDEEKQDKQDKKYKILKDVDIVYVIDATGSMGYEINAVKSMFLLFLRN